jgi:hypothetical protein
MGKEARSYRDFLAEAAGALAVVAGALGLGPLGTLLPPPDPAAGYPGSAVEASGDEGVRVWLVDGFNVLHAGVLRGRDRAQWWREDRRAALLERARRFRPARGGAEVCVVFDGSGPPAPGEVREGGPGVVFAPSADEWLLERVRSDPDPARLAVVTSDRRLAERARRRGARVVSPLAFLARC